eukprot:6490242-Amphidinium_carterae.2
MSQEPQSEPEPTPSSVGQISRGTQTYPLVVEFAEPSLRALGPHRAYVVWYLEGARWTAEGVHFGPGAWLGLLSILPSHNYRSGVDHLRRVRVLEDEAEETLVSAGVRLYHSERVFRGAPTPCRVFYWP